MKISVLIVVMLIAESFGGDEEKKGVHFKIHVPEIVKHHFHTKTVFIHVHEMKPQEEEEEEKDKEEHHVEDWTSYNSYNYNDGVEENHAGGYHRKKQKKVTAPLDDYMPIREDDYGPPYSNELPDNLLNNEPPEQDSNLGLFGPPIDPEELMDPRVPPETRYEIHEDIEEERPNDLDQHIYHEQGYRRGMTSETGRLIHKDLKDFYDKENKQADFSKGGYENDAYKKYDKHSYLGNYDKEMSAQQRSGKKKQADRRYFVTRMILR